MSGPSGRATELDGLRTLAILAMIATHLTRLISGPVRGPWCAPSLLLDPLIQALFMGLAGASLAWSWQGAQRAGTSRESWLRSRARRAGEVYLVGVALFFFDKGPQLPHLLLAPGILAAIALSILILAPVASSRHPVAGALGLAALGYAAMAVLAPTPIALPPITAGNAALLPNVPLACLGLAAGIGLLRGDRRVLAGMALPTLALGGWLALRHGPSELLGYGLGRVTSTVDYQGRSHGLAIALDMIRGEPLAVRPVEYFNSSLYAQPFVLALVVALYLLLRLSRPLWQRAAPLLFLPGRASLTSYVLHLLLLGLLVAASGKAKPLTVPWAGEAVFIVVLALVYLAAALQERRSRVRRRSS
jgi:uncharacterized membrane protein